MQILREYRSKSNEKFVFLHKNGTFDNAQKRYCVKTVLFLYTDDEDKANKLFERLSKQKKPIVSTEEHTQLTKNKEFESAMDRAADKILGKSKKARNK